MEVWSSSASEEDEEDKSTLGFEGSGGGGSSAVSAVKKRKCHSSSNSSNNKNNNNNKESLCREVTQGRKRLEGGGWETGGHRSQTPDPSERGRWGKVACSGSDSAPPGGQKRLSAAQRSRLSKCSSIAALCSAGWK